MRLWDVSSGQCRLVIEDLHHTIHDIDYMETTDGGYLVAGSDDGEVRVFKVVVDGDQYQVRLDWRIGKTTLV